MPLKIAAKVDKADREYFETVIKPMLTDPRVEFVGEIGEAQKDDFLGDAAALLFPIDWPEPFGLVMIEAMACGTPVIAFRCGSVPEVMRDGVSGYVVDTLDEAVAATARVARAAARRRAAPTSRSASRRARMASDYVAVYERAGGGRAPPQRAGADGDRAGRDRRRA